MALISLTRCSINSGSVLVNVNCTVWQRICVASTAQCSVATGEA